MPMSYSSNNNKYSIENSKMLHGSFKNVMQNFNARDVRDIFHCSIGGILSIIPIIFIECTNYYTMQNVNKNKNGMNLRLYKLKV